MKNLDAYTDQISVWAPWRTFTHATTPDLVHTIMESHSVQSWAVEYLLTAPPESLEEGEFHTIILSPNDLGGFRQPDEIFTDKAIRYLNDRLERKLGPTFRLAKFSTWQWLAVCDQYVDQPCGEQLFIACEGRKRKQLFSVGKDVNGRPWIHLDYFRGGSGLKDTDRILFQLVPTTRRKFARRKLEERIVSLDPAAIQRIFLTPDGRPKPLDSIAEAYIRTVVDAAGGYMTLAASTLGIGRSTLYRKMSEYEISINETNG